MNKIYISSLKEASVLRDNLSEVSVTYDILRNTKDIWVRDFMPIPLHRKAFDGQPLYAIYRYWPNYLDDEPENDDDVYYITNQPDACRNIKIDHKHCVDLGGRRIIKKKVDKGDKAIITDKIIHENPKI